MFARLFAMMSLSWSAANWAERATELASFMVVVDQVVAVIRVGLCTPRARAETTELAGISARPAPAGGAAEGVGLTGLPGSFCPEEAVFRRAFSEPARNHFLTRKP